MIETKTPEISNNLMIDTKTTYVMDNSKTEDANDYKRMQRSCLLNEKSANENNNNIFHSEVVDYSNENDVNITLTEVVIPSKDNNSDVEKDDCTKEVALSLYDGLKDFQSEEPSEFSSNCSSISPFSDDTPFRPKVEDTCKKLNNMTLQNLDNKEILPFKKVDNTKITIKSIVNKNSVPPKSSDNNESKFVYPEVSSNNIVAPKVVNANILKKKNKKPSNGEYLQLHSEDIFHCIINFPNEYVGRLLGKKGKFAQQIKENTGINVTIDEIIQDGCKCCYLRGEYSNVYRTIELIKELFSKESFPDMVPLLEEITLTNAMPQNKITVDVGNMVHKNEALPVLVSAISTVNCLYVQILNHTMYPQLGYIENCLNGIYNKFETPNIPFPCAVGSLCVCCVNNQWQRCEVIECIEDAVHVCLVDVGCTIEVKPSQLKLALKCITDIPFFAAKVFLHAIQVSPDPQMKLAGNDWLATNVSKYKMFITLVGRDVDETAIVNLWTQREDNKCGLINEELKDLKFAHSCDSNIIAKIREL